MISDGDGVITKNEFLHEWTHTYNDNHHDSEIYFNNLDVNNSGDLDDYDTEQNLKELDADGKTFWHESHYKRDLED